MVAVKKQLLQCTLGKHTGQCRCPGVRDFVAIQTQCYQVGAFGKHHSKCHRPRVRDFLATQRKTSQECTLREKKNSLSTTNTNTDHHVQQILKDVIYPNQKRRTCSKVPLTLIIAWPLKQPIFSMKTYWKVLLSSFGALVPVIRRDQKFKSNSNDTAADRENLI